MTHRLPLVLLGALAMASLVGCTSLAGGPGMMPNTDDLAKVEPGNVYASKDDLRDKGDLSSWVQVDLWNKSQQKGEVINVDIWPIAGVGLGLLGARAHIGPLGIGAGTLWYAPVDAAALKAPAAGGGDAGGATP